MVNLNMNGPTRDQVLKFMEEKDKIEQEIQELTSVLLTNNVGMHEPLVDFQGFPRNDIDVYRIRHARNRIICLQNDHKEIMKQIERGIHTVHSEFTGNQEAASRSHTDNPQAMEVGPSSSAAHITNGNGHALTNGHGNGVGEDNRVALVVEATNNLRVSDRAFVKVNFVSTGSPADNAGIQVNDEILCFGSINSGNYNNLSQIGEVVQHSVGARLDVRIRRGSDILNASLVPGPWSGRGLLGCNIIPI